MDSRPYSDPAAARVDFRAVAPDLHAPSCAMRSRSPRSNGIDGLWNRRHRRTNGTAHSRLGPALHPFWRARVLGNGGALRRSTTFGAKSPRAKQQGRLSDRSSASQPCLLLLGFEIRRSNLDPILIGGLLAV